MSILKIQPLKNNRFKILEPFLYEDITVPKEYKTNGADVPRIFWIFFPPFAPKRLDAVVVHDYLCECAFMNSFTKEEFIKNIEHANEKFEEILLKSENSFINKVAISGVKVYWKIRFKFNIKLPTF